MKGSDSTQVISLSLSLSHTLANTHTQSLKHFHKLDTLTQSLILSLRIPMQIQSPFSVYLVQFFLPFSLTNALNVISFLPLHFCYLSLSLSLSLSHSHTHTLSLSLSLTSLILRFYVVWLLRENSSNASEQVSGLKIKTRTHFCSPRF